jgi:hypothetical protein
LGTLIEAEELLMKLDPTDELVISMKSQLIDIRKDMMSKKAEFYK